MSKTVIYNKLVRDKIPDIIRANNAIPTTTILDDAQYETELHTKLEEEVREYLQDNNVEELADILELLHALAALHGATPTELERIRAEKAMKRGGFADRIFLVQTEE